MVLVVMLTNIAYDTRQMRRLDVELLLTYLLSPHSLVARSLKVDSPEAELDDEIEVS